MSIMECNLETVIYFIEWIVTAVVQDDNLRQRKRITTLRCTPTTRCLSRKRFIVPRVNTSRLVHLTEGRRCAKSSSHR
ncbi:hypothetical protein ALC57_17984 [Trachymyrmex cornetzi]|uniref:Uncharacterized protein n=1 Tax=Trachymyrmex cornetzi TaxID=471704 RepID=A0A151ISW9_9HYME|nr:hypothetical protein ALC57_17984 [Trachymyrmex cornetzi]